MMPKKAPWAAQEAPESASPTEISPKTYPKSFYSGTNFGPSGEFD